MFRRRKPMVKPPIAPQPANVQGEPGSRHGEIEGFVDAFDGHRVVGWAHDRAAPGRRLCIEVVAGDGIMTVVAAGERKDVAATGRNDGFCGFSAIAHLDVLGEDLIHVREASTGIALSGSPIDPARAGAEPMPTPHGIEGFIDFVDGNRIVGWIYDRALPGRRLQVAIDAGETTAVIVADRFRQDVASSGLNDGFCGFEFDFDLRAAGRRLIRVREASTGLDLNGSPFRPDLLNRIAGQDKGAALALLRVEAERALSSVVGARS